MKTVTKTIRTIKTIKTTTKTTKIVNTNFYNLVFLTLNCKNFEAIYNLPKCKTISKFTSTYQQTVRILPVVHRSLIHLTASPLKI